MIVYRKHGSVARWENGTLIRVVESGIAVEDGDSFECRPAERGDASAAFETVDVPAALQTLSYERLIVTHGVAHHECEGRTWREETRRVHASLVHGKLRALVDTTAERIDELFAIAAALRRAEPDERTLAAATLNPNVTAALLPHLVHAKLANVRVIQTAGGVDGYGRPIVETAGDWPNAYRPSYRVRPVRMPLDLRLECDDTRIDEDAPRAVALLAPVAGLTLRVLVEDGPRVYPATVSVRSIRAVSADRIWYPYGGGSFGAALML